MSRIAYVNGAFVPLADARISILDRGFLFADGVYEVTAVLDGRLVDNAPHLARLERSLREIALPLPCPLATIQTIQNELIRRNGLTEGVVYLQVTRGAADRDFVFPANVPPTLVMFTQTKTIVEAPAATTGIAVATLPDIRWSRRDIKAIALLPQVLAKQAAAERGCQEAWLIAPDGTVTEGGSSSAFIITRGRTLVTRQATNDILPGCTRLATLALAREERLPIEERSFTRAEALEAAEAFITSASSFVMPVVKIDGHTLGDGAPGPLTRRLREIYIAFCRRPAAG